MPRVLLFGAGAIGAVYAYIFTKAGASVTAVCRSNYTAAKAHGFSIRSDLYGNIKCSPSILRSVSEAKGPFDYVVLCSKASPESKPLISEVIKPAVDSKTAIVLIQNGIGIEEEYRAAFPNNPIVSCVVYCPATEIELGVIWHGSFESLEVGTYPHDAPEEHKKAAQSFVDLVEKAGATIKLFDDVQVQRWIKLIVNASWNPICALTRSADVKFMEASESSLPWIRSVMMEVVAIAQAYGYDTVNHEIVDWQLSRAKQRLGTEGIEPSMLTDVRRGRRIEVEAISGNAVRLAEAKGVQVPLLKSLYTLAKALDESIARDIATK